MNAIRKIKILVSKADIYPTSANFTFDKSVNFRSAFGGIFSIIILSFMAFFSFSSMTKVINREIKSTMISKTFMNLFQDQREHKFMENGAEFIFTYISSVVITDENGYIAPNYMQFNVYESENATVGVPSSSIVANYDTIDTEA
jgi:hypothetical protein